jgi:hypothetical protein
MGMEGEPCAGFCGCSGRGSAGTHHWLAAPAPAAAAFRRCLPIAVAALAPTPWVSSHTRLRWYKSGQEPL